MQRIETAHNQHRPAVSAIHEPISADFGGGSRGWRLGSCPGPPALGFDPARVEGRDGPTGAGRGGADGFSSPRNCYTAAPRSPQGARCATHSSVQFVCRLGGHPAPPPGREQIARCLIARWRGRPGSRTAYGLWLHCRCRNPESPATATASGRASGRPCRHSALSATLPCPPTRSFIPGKKNP